MQTRTYQIIGTSSQANSANVSVIAPGYISAIVWAITMDSVTDNAQLYAELSFQSSSQVATHNALGIIDVCSYFQNFLTSGLAPGVVNRSLSGLYIPLGIGQILYLNQSFSGGSASTKALVHVIER